MMPFRSSLPALALGAALLIPGLASAAACNTSTMTLGGVTGACDAVADADIGSTDSISSVASSKKDAVERMAKAATGNSGWTILGFQADDGDSNGFAFGLDWVPRFNPLGGSTGDINVKANEPNGGAFSIDLDILALVRLGDSSGANIDGFLAFTMLGLSFDDQNPSNVGSFEMTGAPGSTAPAPTANAVLFLGRQSTPGGTVPEPGSIALLGAIGATLVAGRRRVKR